jgi:vacuolar-type H+-ATPase subunit E/Vma4
MEREASATADEIRRKALERAESITAEARSRLVDRRDDAVQARALALRQESNRILGEARRKSRARLLRLQHEVLQRIRREARSRLARVDAQEALRSRLPEDLDRARGYLADGALAVRASRGLAEHFSARVGRPLQVTADPAILAGFTVTSEDGAVMVDQTLEHRLDAMWPALGIELARALEQP